VGNIGGYWAQTERAALFVREGHPNFALLAAEHRLWADSRPGRAVLNWPWLALAYQKKGNLNEAKRWLEKVAYWLNQESDRMPHQFSPGWNRTFTTGWKLTCCDRKRTHDFGSSQRYPVSPLVVYLPVQIFLSPGNGELGRG
jgi:hypothetical protein